MKIGELDRRPHVQARFLRHARERVRQRDVHIPERVLHQLAKLSGSIVGDVDAPLTEAPKQFRGALPRRERHATDDSLVVHQLSKVLPGSTRSGQ